MSQDDSKSYIKTFLKYFEGSEETDAGARESSSSNGESNNGGCQSWFTTLLPARLLRYGHGTCSSIPMISSSHATEVNELNMEETQHLHTESVENSSTSEADELIDSNPDMEVHHSPHFLTKRALMWQFYGNIFESSGEVQVQRHSFFKTELSELCSRNEVHNRQSEILNFDKHYSFFKDDYRYGREEQNSPIGSSSSSSWSSQSQSKGNHEQETQSGTNQNQSRSKHHTTGQSSKTRRQNNLKFNCKRSKSTTSENGCCASKRKRSDHSRHHRC